MSNVNFLPGNNMDFQNWNTLYTVVQTASLTLQYLVFQIVSFMFATLGTSARNLNYLTHLKKPNKKKKEKKSYAFSVLFFFLIVSSFRRTVKPDGRVSSWLLKAAFSLSIHSCQAECQANTDHIPALKSLAFLWVFLFFF